MKVFFTTVILAIGLLVVPCNFVLAEKYSPNEKIDEVIEEMGELEENFEENKWGEAQESAEKIENEIKEIVARIQTDDLDIQGAAENLKKAVAGKNSEETELAYITFQKRFFSLLNDFDYEVHPVLSILEQYIIDEAGEAAEKNDIDEVISDIRESGNLFKYAKPIFLEKGVSQQDLKEFNAKIIDLLLAGKKKDNKKVYELLKEIQEQYKTFMTVIEKT